MYSETLLGFFFETVYLVLFRFDVLTLGLAAVLAENQVACVTNGHVEETHKSKQKSRQLLPASSMTVFLTV